MNVGLLDDSGQRFLRRAPWLQERREVGTAPELRDAQFDAASSGLPIAVSIAIALRQAVRVALAMRSTGHAADLQFHQALGGKADHLTQHARIRAFRQQLTQGSLLIGHRGVLGSELYSQPNPT